MHNAILVKGRLIGPQTVELEEPISGFGADVEVVLRPADANGHIVANPAAESLWDFLRRLPPGVRSREDIDRQIADEREWGRREGR